MLPPDIAHNQRSVDPHDPPPLLPADELERLRATEARYAAMVGPSKPKRGGGAHNCREVVFRGVAYRSILLAAEAHGIKPQAVRRELGMEKRVPVAELAARRAAKERAKRLEMARALGRVGERRKRSPPLAAVK